MKNKYQKVNKQEQSIIQTMNGEKKNGIILEDIFLGKTIEQKLLKVQKLNL